MFREKQQPVMIRTQRDYERELDALYARREVVDELIASLEAYDRYRSTTATAIPVTADPARKSA